MIGNICFDNYTSPVKRCKLCDPVHVSILVVRQSDIRHDSKVKVVKNYSQISFSRDKFSEISDITAADVVH